MKLLVTGAWNGAQKHFSELEQMGHEICFLEWEKDPIPCGYAWPEGVMCNGLFQYHPIEMFANLRFIQLTSAGVDRVPMDYVAAHGIEIHSARGVYSIPMAEYAVAGMLQLYKQARFFAENQKARRWEKHRGLMELYGKTVCIVGCGSVGTECAKRFRAFGAHVIGVNRTLREDPAFERIVGLDELDDWLPRADVLVLTVALTEQTRRLMDRDRFGRMKTGAVLVNISRGAIVDEDAMTEAMRSGCLAGAVLDVFAQEPLPEDSPLWEMENVILTPHNSFVGEGNEERLVKTLLDGLWTE